MNTLKYVQLNLQHQKKTVDKIGDVVELIFDKYTFDTILKIYEFLG